MSGVCQKWSYGPKQHNLKVIGPIRDSTEAASYFATYVSLAMSIVLRLSLNTLMSIEHQIYFKMSFFTYFTF